MNRITRIIPIVAICLLAVASSASADGAQKVSTAAAAAKKCPAGYRLVKRAMRRHGKVLRTRSGKARYRRYCKRVTAQPSGSNGSGSTGQTQNNVPTDPTRNLFPGGTFHPGWMHGEDKRMGVSIDLIGGSRNSSSVPGASYTVDCKNNAGDPRLGEACGGTAYLYFVEFTISPDAYWLNYLNSVNPKGALQINCNYNKWNPQPTKHPYASLFASYMVNWQGPGSYKAELWATSAAPVQALNDLGWYLTCAVIGTNNYTNAEGSSWLPHIGEAMMASYF